MNRTVRSAEIAGRSVGVSVEDVDLSYGSTRVLKGVSLEIRPGEFFTFLGPSGCGKTTLLRLIAGFGRAERGSVRIGGEDVSGLPPWKRDVGMVFQSYALWPHLSVFRNVAFGLEERRVPKAEIAERVGAALELVGLSGYARRRPSELSGGQQQRVALARTIVIRPKLLLLDEPLSNLDAKLRVQVRRELRDLQRSLGLTTVFVTHDQEEANTVSDRIAVMSDGMIRQVGAPMELYDRPADLFVAGFLGTANILGGRIMGEGRERCFVLDSGARVPVAPDASVPQRARLVFRPQNAVLASSDAPPVPSSLRLTGTIAHSEFLGSAVRYGVRIGEAEVLVDVPHQTGRPALAPGTAAAVDVAADKVLFLGD